MTNRFNVGTPAPAIHHPYHLSVFIGRFQPFHLGHLSVVERALGCSDTVLICVGSSGQPRDTFNPFSFEERAAMIRASLSDADRGRVLILPIYDYTYNDAQWVVGVQDAVRDACEHFGLDDFAKVALIGHSKDHTSFYLKLFPQWNSVNVPGFVSEDFVLSASMIRDEYFLARDWGNLRLAGRDASSLMPEAVLSFLSEFAVTDAYRNIREEFEFVQRYKEPFKALPYPPIFSTVDACVVQSGHVLLVERRARPGKGLWALPGGFLNANERIEDAVYRELREETKIKVPEAVLRGSTVTSRVFDDVHRSARGRTITHAFLIHLKPDTELPKVKGSDDAAKARWVPLSDVGRHNMFEDHFHMVSALIALI